MVSKFLSSHRQLPRYRWYVWFSFPTSVKLASTVTVFVLITLSAGLMTALRIQTTNRHCHRAPARNVSLSSLMVSSKTTRHTVSPLIRGYDLVYCSKRKRPVIFWEYVRMCWGQGGALLINDARRNTEINEVRRRLLALDCLFRPSLRTINYLIRTPPTLQTGSSISGHVFVRWHS